jgi:hypothetical protein
MLDLKMNVILLVCCLVSNTTVCCQKVDTCDSIDSYIQNIQQIWVKHQADTSKWTYFDGETMVLDSLQSIIHFDDFQKENNLWAKGIFSNLFENKYHRLLQLDDTNCFLEKKGNTYSIYFPNGMCRIEIVSLTKSKMVLARSQSEDCDELIEEEYFPYKR